jgi:putative transposase
MCPMSRSGNVGDNAAMESFFSSLKTERTARKTYRTREDAKADVFDYIERFYNRASEHSSVYVIEERDFADRDRSRGVFWVLSRALGYCASR